MSADDEVPSDHPVHQIWENDKKTEEQLAGEGDQDAIRNLLVAFRFQRHRNEVHPFKDRRMVGPEDIVLPLRLYDFFDACMGRILAGAEPNTVIGRKRADGRPGRRGLSAQEKEARCRLAHRVGSLLPERPKRSDIKRAVLSVVQETGEPESKVREAYAWWYTRPGKPGKTP